MRHVIPISGKVRNYPLADIRKNREKILMKRARQVAAVIIRGKLHRDPIDELSLKSCGLFCGK